MPTPIHPRASLQTPAAPPMGAVPAVSSFWHWLPSAPRLLGDREFAEAVITGLVVALLLPLFLQLRALGAEGDGRYVQGRLQQVHLPGKQLPGMCSRFGQVLGEQARAVCGSVDVGAQDPTAQVPVELDQAMARIRESFVEPLRPALEVIRDREKRGAEGLTQGDLLADAEALAEIRASIAPYMSSYAMEAAPLEGPRPLQCVAAAFPAAWNQAAHGPTRARLALWLAATLDGAEASAFLDDAAASVSDRKGDGRELVPACDRYDSLQDAAGAAAAMLRDARVDAMQAAKSDAMRYLLKNAWWQFLLWSVLGLWMVLLSRRSNALWAATGATLVLWALVAWGCRVWLPLPEAVNGLWAVSRKLPVPLPPWPILALAGVGIGAWVAGVDASRRRPRAAPGRQVCASRFAYGAWLLFVGLGWLVLLDLSATGHPRNRFLALYQQGFLWGAFALLCLASIWRQAVARSLLRVLATVQAVGPRFAAKVPMAPWLGPFMLLILVAVAFAALQNQRQLTSELGRLWLILGVAWLFHVRGDLVFNLAQNAGWRTLFKFVSPLLTVLLALAAAMVITDDKGPLLIVAYAGGIFLSAVVMYGLQRNGSHIVIAGALGMCALVLWCALLTEALYALGPLNALTARRLESAANPLMSTNDQIGLISWFRQATPTFGFGVGNVPWCGYATGGSCRGVPLQIQSDYSFTALWGLLGGAACWSFVATTVIWVWRLIAGHSRVTSGNAVAVRDPDGGRLAADPQALLSWICVTWLVLCLCQTAVTVAGNLRVLPLTGVTYPFVSFCRISIWMNVLFLGLCLNVNRPGEERRA